ncbi:VCBS repeat-containing protein [Hydrogenophaga sp. PAMC20947]|uniref:FG-GAP repeat domain-containing protein n=1 Tax=Hydrogenophaga sp. PAMC20947 TaxID=2565558 RepID=UPI00109E308D|nr:VCBS repeat-containing protein [Hydrogenophaga sp. PAMC20947]QCB44798.1 VCBS repeat-containing protein [Hydrogenophaga sp. PAMC20947]
MPALHPRLRRTTIRLTFTALCAATVLWANQAKAMGLMVEAHSVCPAPTGPAPLQTPLPRAAQQRIPDSQAVPGQNHIAWVWLASPTLRYPHGALGAKTHAASLHALVQDGQGGWTTASVELPLHRVFEDRVPRLADLDGDGRDEILVIEADALRGAAVVVWGVVHSGQPATPPRLVRRATSPRAGSTFRWLNPVGVADFDGDGKPDVASVTTPHIGGTLTLYHYRPPRLVPFANAMDVSNHRMGAVEQALAVIVEQPGTPPTIVVPDMTRRALHALRWEAPGQWNELADLVPMAGLVERLGLRSDGSACATLSDRTTSRVTLTH